MLELPHTVVGAAIATKIGNPILALPLAFASHFILDMVPHWNPHLNTELKTNGKIGKVTTLIVVVDMIASAIAGLYIASIALPDKNSFSFILLGALMGILPDALEAPYFFLRWRYLFIEKLVKFQKGIQNDAPVFWGLLTQVITLAAAFWWIFN